MLGISEIASVEQEVLNHDLCYIFIHFRLVLSWFNILIIVNAYANINNLTGK